ncbi:MAG: hypothetical protein FE78DRAFT_540305 [Acidomyces sp. 'richmondensis']|nr:MAG: hypothetical protein FE78DRAFT_540305 [Acidomyces sp. 'richmondensis']
MYLSAEIGFGKMPGDLSLQLQQLYLKPQDPAAARIGGWAGLAATGIAHHSSRQMYVVRVMQACNCLMTAMKHVSAAIVQSSVAVAVISSVKMVASEETVEFCCSSPTWEGGACRSHRSHRSDRMRGVFLSLSQAVVEDLRHRALRLFGRFRHLALPSALIELTTTRAAARLCEYIV